MYTLSPKQVSTKATELRDASLYLPTPVIAEVQLQRLSEMLQRESFSKLGIDEPRYDGSLKADVLVKDLVTAISAKVIELVLVSNSLSDAQLGRDLLLEMQLALTKKRDNQLGDAKLHEALQNISDIGNSHDKNRIVINSQVLELCRDGKLAAVIATLDDFPSHQKFPCHELQKVLISALLQDENISKATLASAVKWIVSGKTVPFDSVRDEMLYLALEAGALLDDKELIQQTLQGMSGKGRQSALSKLQLFHEAKYESVKTTIAQYTIDRSSHHYEPPRKLEDMEGN